MSLTLPGSSNTPPMLQPPPPFTLRPLRLDDLDAVIAIERASFPNPARVQLYQHELAHNELAHYQALTVGQDGRAEQLVGYAGYWLMGDELHVSIIAVDPPWRGHGLGELLLLNLLYLAYDHASALVTLEVRAGNHVAQALYRKYGFDLVGERRRYYRDTGEDALLMTVVLAAAPAERAQLDRQRDALWQRLSGAHF